MPPPDLAGPRVQRTASTRRSCGFSRSSPSGARLGGVLESLGDRLISHRRWGSVGVALVSLAVVACGSDGDRSVQSLAGNDFEARSVDICGDHAQELDGLFEGSDLLDTETDEEIARELERVRRELLELKSRLLDDLRQIEPEGREAEWSLALAELEDAVERAGAGDHVDVQVDGAFESVNRLIDDFGLESCF